MQQRFPSLEFTTLICNEKKSPKGKAYVKTEEPRLDKGAGKTSPMAEEEFT